MNAFYFLPKWGYISPTGRNVSPILITSLILGGTSMFTITVPGTLIINSHQREDKLIKSGWLKSPIGDFNVKYSQLDFIDNGEYDGLFTIAKISQGCYGNQGKYYFEVEAILEKVAFSHAVISATDTQKSVKEKRSEKTSDKKEPSDNGQNTLLDDDMPNDEELFGSLWPLQDQVKLDSTHDRNRIRAQCERLHQLGYLPNSKEQVWYKANQNMAN